MGGRILDLGLYAAIGTQKMQELTEEQRLRLARQVELVRSFSQRSVVRGFELLEGTAVVGRLLDIRHSSLDLRHSPPCISPTRGA